MAEAARKVRVRVPYVSDKELHVSLVASPNDGDFVDLREFIPSLKQYGRGITFPLELLDEVSGGLEAIRHELGGAKEDG